MCIDYHPQNKVSIKKTYHIPVIDDLFNQLRGVCWFFKIYVRSDYNQLKLGHSGIPKIVSKTLTLQGHCKFVVMYFGLTTSLGTFIDFLNWVFKQYFDQFFLSFYDDIIIYFLGKEDPATYLRVVLQTLKDQQLFFKFNKCELWLQLVTFLGHVVSNKGMLVVSKKTEVVKHWLRQNSTPDIRRFLGSVGHYNRFLKDFHTQLPH